MSGSRQSEREECVWSTVRMWNNYYIWGPLSPHSHTASTTALPCVRHLTSAASPVVIQTSLCHATELPGAPVSSCAENSISPAASGLFGANVFLVDWSWLGQPTVQGLVPLFSCATEQGCGLFRPAAL